MEKVTLDRMNHLSIENFKHDGQTIDSLYRLVNLAAKRANQLHKPDARSLVTPVSRKPVITALQEILEGKVWYRTGGENADEYEIV
jgi:DNA-directed RNA polymerase omega subunit